MCDETLGSETFEVPIMLSAETISYEDIAKLNPFYEEYHAFWADSVDVLDTSYSSDGSSTSFSLRSISSEESSFHPFEFVPPPLCHSQSHPTLPVPNKYPIAFHNGGGCKPAYNAFEGRQLSHVGVLECAEEPKQPLSPMYESSEFLEPGVKELDSFDCSFTRARASHKKLFGQNGWLGCTAELDGRTNNKSKSKALKGLGKKLKEHVEEIASDVAKIYPTPFHGSCRSSTVSDPTIPITLDPSAQAKLYSKMEVMICVSANCFLVHQYHEGRLSKDSIKKINSFWGSKNRPQVIEFQFDQATQRRLILSNIRTLHFNGESSTNPVLLHSNLQNWKAIVKEMSVRTFCAPDSVIRKHMHDIHKLLDMLGAPFDTFMAFQELQMRTLSLMKDRLEKSHLAGDRNSGSEVIRSYGHSAGFR